MEHKITQIFVPSAADASAATNALTAGEIAVFDPALSTNKGATPTTGPFKLVVGTGNTKFGSFKTSTIDPANVLYIRKTVPANKTPQQQISYIGYDESSAATPTFACDEEYVVTIKIDEYWSKGIFQPMIQESVRVKTACCSECGGNCDALDAEVYMTEIADLINANPILSKYITAAKVGSGANWGVKLTGNALDEFGNACVPDAVPYVFNLVRFQTTVHPGPMTTMDFDLEDFCATWAITTTQQIAYTIGAGAALAELERNFYSNNLPATHEARRYWNPIYNNDSDALLFVNSTKYYNMYEVVYNENSPVGFEKKSTNTHSVVVLVDDSNSALNTAVTNLIEDATGLSF